MEKKRDKRVYALYFTPLHSREFSGKSESWRLYYGDGQLNGEREGRVCEARFSGDTYLSPDIKDISGTYYPVIGPYDIADPDVAEYHVLLAKASGMDGFFADWHFREAETTRGIFNLARTAAKYDFKIGIDWVNIVLFLWKQFESRQDCLEEAKKDLLYVLEELYAIAGIFRDGRPVVLVFDSHSEQAKSLKQEYFSAEDLQAIRRFVNDGGQQPLILTRTISALEKKRMPLQADEHDFSCLEGSVDEGMIEAVDGFFPWVNHYGTEIPQGGMWTSYSSRQYQVACLKEHYRACAALKGLGKIDFFLGGVFPGFDDHKGQAWGMGEKRLIPRDDGQLLTDTWEALSETDVDTAFVVTWNDWVEATHLEPSVELGYTELEACSRQISRWKGIDIDTHLLHVPEMIFHLRKSCQLYVKAGFPSEKRCGLTDLLDQVARMVAEKNLASALRLLDQASELSDSIMRQLKKTRIALLWEFGVTAHGIEVEIPNQCGVVEVDGAQGAAFSDPNTRVYCTIADGKRKEMQEGCFIGRLSLEYLDEGNGFIKVYTDAREERLRLIADFHMEATGKWKRASLDLVNSVFDKGLESGADVIICQPGNNHGGIRLIRMDGMVYSFCMG